MGRSLWIAAPVVVVAAAGAVYYFTQGRTPVLDAAGQELVRQAEAACAVATPDPGACRRVLTAIEAHPQHRDFDPLIRSRARLQLALGDAIGAEDTAGSLLDVRATAADMWLGARIHARRHAETGLDVHGERGSEWAELYYNATGDVPALFLAWQLAIRVDNADSLARAATLAKRLESHGATVQARIVACLPAYPREVPSDRKKELQALLEEASPVPAELALANAWLEINDPERRGIGLKRAEDVLRELPSSRTARMLVCIACLGLKQWDKAREQAEWLVKQSPRHRDVGLYRKLLQSAEARGG
ncbi:MAG: hypothetical protein KDC87_14425 [Planctomycetes bacterium]|nr:hypothetical protein [Planctomycetota bacterium]MCB9868338.1 hypothetical protein [Planctomycetota bacterium]